MDLNADKKAKNRAYYLANKEKIKARSRAQKKSKRNIITERKSSIKRKYNIDWNEFLLLFEQANNRCEICHKPLQIASTKQDNIESASVDHCHTTGKVRGVLCRGCNVALGHFQDNRLYLENAIKYLDKHGY